VIHPTFISITKHLIVDLDGEASELTVASEDKVLVIFSILESLVIMFSPSTLATLAKACHFIEEGLLDKSFSCAGWLEKPKSTNMENEASHLPISFTLSSFHFSVFL
jgi:hypothetical protein